ncbi:type II secretion system protein [Rhodoferax sp. GW822-FHT02A01]|uniref:type II secretion system protein n=1 Tax=Rhodoferax sp. GW822-FHT02A01 TaxID=3141537 RepID=UPI00315C724D
MTHRARGFTLIELVVTVALVGILAMVAVPLGTLSVQRLREGELRSSLRQIREALDAYKRASDSGRIARRADGSGYPQTLEELEAGVVDAKNPNKTKIYFLRRLPRDPFFADTSVPAAATWGKRSYASAPDMPMEGDDVFDVYSHSDRIGLNGIPLRDW